MRIYVLGPLTVESGTSVLHERDLPGNQARVALAMLAVEHRRPISRDEIADELWPDRLPSSWQTALRAIISKVRIGLTDAGFAHVKDLPHLTSLTIVGVPGITEAGLAPLAGLVELTELKLGSRRY